MDNSLVSIIIPAYNSESFIAETLDSVLSQTYRNWECIIVDDGSTDGTRPIVERYIQKDSRFQYRHQENQGPSVARNNAIAHSSGKYILPVDADDMITPFYVVKAVDYFEQFPSTKLVYGLVSFFGDKTGMWDLPEYNYNDFIFNNCIISSAMFKREDYAKTSGYNPNMVYGHEDWDLWLSLLDKDSIVHRLNEVVYFYRKQKQSRTTSAIDNLTLSLRQLYVNHEEIYSSYVKDIISLKNQVTYLVECQSELEHIRNTKAYRIGKIITRPFSWFRSLFQ